MMDNPGAGGLGDLFGAIFGVGPVNQHQHQQPNDDDRFLNAFVRHLAHTVKDKIGDDVSAATLLLVGVAATHVRGDVLASRLMNVQHYKCFMDTAAEAIAEALCYVEAEEKYNKERSERLQEEQDGGL